MISRSFRSHSGTFESREDTMIFTAGAQRKGNGAKRIFVLFGLISLIICQVAWSAAHIRVATADSSEAAKKSADFVGDGNGDQEEIHAAIKALPAAGGVVELMAGTYDIRKVSGTLGGVTIDRSNVTLAGEGECTLLRLAAGQNTNVIRIIGPDVGHVTIRDLWVDQNRDENTFGEGDPNVSHGRFEFCGIKAFQSVPGGPGDQPTHDITIQNCRISNARRLGIMLEGPNMRVQNNHLGNALSDSVEILTGPGFITGNYVEITGRTHVGVGSDRGNSIIMSNNVIHVRETGDIDIGFRSWANSERHVISGNIIQIDKGGKLGAAMEVRGYGAAVTGNSVQGNDPENLLPLKLTGAGNIVTGNYFSNVKVVVDDETKSDRLTVLTNNLMENSVVEHIKGNLKQD
ncbi:MAG: hypothetical protein UZ16_OP3001000115 [Candidatus Hinthialibacteria bacterium OLB16]|nr:MAG: hypothetical protein UZ16_OP3001000115 [Candidatus Hinthialibacteria bacterium OLB16]